MKAVCGLILMLAWPLGAATVRVQVAGQRGPIELSLERYVAGVLAGEASVFQSEEALKAMAVAARTFAVRMQGRHKADGFDLCGTTHCQRLELAAVTERLESAAAETAGELLWFAGKPAYTPYARDCGGRTEDAAAVWPDLAAPYLKSHPDEYCSGGGSETWNWSADPREVARALARAGLRSPRTLEAVTILDRTGAGRASVLLLAGGGESIRISASSFRFAIGRELGWDKMHGEAYTVRAAGGRIVFEGRGAGHGVGLCQRGAERMGAKGRSYREILAYYYPGTMPGLTARGLGWQRLRGDELTLVTTQPERDRAVLAMAERAAAGLVRRTRWPLPVKTEIRVYPDLDTFRNATAEPGWVAAHTEGRRIHLQPAAILSARGVLEQTIEHELLHVLVESQARRELPLWFREGLVGFLGGEGKSGSARVVADAELRQTADAARARRAYTDAAAMVARLAASYGEATVLGWVGRGLPPEVIKASASQPTPNKR